MVTMRERNTERNTKERGEMKRSEHEDIAAYWASRAEALKAKAAQRTGTETEDRRREFTGLAMARIADAHARAARGEFSRKAR